MKESKDREEKTRCQITRVGIVERFENEYAAIAIGGKTVEIPKAKVDPSVKLGDDVRWNGDKWQTHYDTIR